MSELVNININAQNNLVAVETVDVGFVIEHELY